MLSTITIDVGTTSVKLCLFDQTGALLASGRQPTPTVSDPWGEIYDVAALEGLIIRFVAGLPAEQRAAVMKIAITGVGESGGLVREDGTLASPMILWHDQRGAALLSTLGPSERHEIYRVTGLPANANYGLSKTAWSLQQTGSDAAGALWLNVSEYLAARMTGERWSEPSLASRTMALDLRRRAWSAEIAGLLGVPVGTFAPLRNAAEGSPLTAAFAGSAGLSSVVEVHVSGHDHIVGAAGAGLRQGELLNSTGTTEGLLVLRDSPSTDESTELIRLANGLACSGEDFTLFASIPTGGSAFATLQSMLGLDATALAAVIERVHGRYLAGELVPSDCPLVLPQFRGSPPPDKDARARGFIAGIGTATTLDELVLGTFLGMVLQFDEVLALFPERPDRIKVIGPAGRNPLWLQLKADLLEAPLSVSLFPEVVSAGAQALASAGPRSWDRSDPHEVAPDPGRSAKLAVWRDDVLPLWDTLKGAGR
ncbi:L-fuculokinase [Herbiconiux sp. VKM Ac-2851]|uniref:FGGY-family carbohydrate kinase n=1 Tax=Herbiconiux sp. VKM Ac-2851 TaxID=2739025 RepID=UPI001566EF15|nr:FGGY family carbohydrate kinase [Herbiconiux sp. VKM Ac-2851]NQX36418.1 hypothetical protein [Herbiconiux sp. VKM Ac-2851]